MKIPVDRLRFNRKTPASTPPQGQVDLKFDPVTGAFKMVDDTGTSAPVGGAGAIQTAAQATALRAAIGTVPQRKYMHGPDAGLRNLRAHLERLEDGAIGFLGDSTFRDSAAVPTSFATALAARYPTHRVELRRAANDMQSIGLTIVQEGPTTRRHRLFAVSTVRGCYMGTSMARADAAGAAAIRLEGELSFPSASLATGWPSALTYMIGQGAGGVKNQFFLNSNGRLGVSVVKTGGGSATDLTASTTVPAMTADVPVRYRVDFVADNGSNSTGRFYWSTDQGVTWTEIGTQQTAAQASVALVAASPYWIGIPATGGTTIIFRIHHAQVGIGATFDPILPERIDQWTNGSGQTTNTPALAGDPVIYIDQAAKDGATITTGGFFTGSGAGLFQTEAYRCWTDHKPDAVVFGTSHNDVGLYPVDWETQMDAAVVVILARYAYDPLILHSTQNPEKDGDQGELTAQHQRRQADILEYAARKSRGCTDIYQAWLDADNSAYDHATPGNVHPTAAGYAFWGRVFLDCFLAGTNEPPATIA